MQKTTKRVAVALAAVIGIVVVAASVIRSAPAERQDQSAAERQNRPVASAAVDPIEPPTVRRLSRVVEGVPFSFRVPAPGWVNGPIERQADGFRSGRLFISKSTFGPQGAEGIVLWTSFPHGDRADLCPDLLSLPADSPAADLAAAVASAPGTELVTGPADVTVGGHPAKHVVLTVRNDDPGCDPGFFYYWHGECWGPCWVQANVGDTIRVWIVDVDGIHLFIEAETTAQGLSLEGEIQQIVESIRFDRRTREHEKAKTPKAVEIAERFMKARNAHNAAKAMSLLADDGVSARLLWGNALYPYMPTVRMNRRQAALALEAERLYGVRYRSVRCRRHPVWGSEGKAQILCSYRMDSRLRQISGLPPMRGSFGIGVRNSRVHYTSFPWLNVSFPRWVPDEGTEFAMWLAAEHPEAGEATRRGKLFRTMGQELVLILSPRSLELLARYLDEYERAG